MIQNIESNQKIISKENSNKFLNKNNYIYFERLEKRAKNKLIKRYDKPISFHDVKMINDILYNEKTHYVEMFKEYLIYEDYNEFLKQYYSDPILSKKLEKILIFYEKYSKIFPNYTVIRESKYLYKNIKRKQKMINQMNENKKNEYSDDENYSDSLSYNKTIFNSRVINSIYTGHNTINLSKTNSTLADNKSIETFINKISLFEKKLVKEEKDNKNNKINSHEKINITNNKNEEQNINKKNTNILVNSILTPVNNSFLKNKINKDNNKKNIIENYLNNAINNNKLMFKPINYNYFPKQRSFSNIVSTNKKVYTSIKHKNVIKNNKNKHLESNNLLNKQNISNTNNANIFNNINESYRSNNLNNFFDYDKYKKIILSTNNTSSHKILTERVFSSPGRRKNVLFIKKKYKSNSKKKNQIKNSNNNKNLVRRNISSNIFNKIQKNISKNKTRINNTNNKNNNNFFREEKKIFKCQINKQNQKKLINNFNPDSVNKLYSSNISNLNIKNKNSKNNNTLNNNKNKIVNNYNIMNGIMNNSTQINIYTGNDLIKSLNLYWNSIINSTRSPSAVNDNNLNRKKNGSKSVSKNNKKLKNENLKKFIEKHWKDKKYKEPYTERNSNNEKFLKLLDIYCRDAKQNKSTNLKKNFNKNKLNKSHNYNHNYNSKSNLEIKSMGDANKKFSTNDLIKDKDKEKSTNNMSHLILKKYNYYKNKNLKEGKK